MKYCISCKQEMTTIKYIEHMNIHTDKAILISILQELADINETLRGKA